MGMQKEYINRSGGSSNQLALDLESNSMIFASLSFTNDSHPQHSDLPFAYFIQFRYILLHCVMECRFQQFVLKEIRLHI